MKDGKIYFIEVKNNTGRLTKGQKRSGLFNLKNRKMLEENVRRLHIWFQQKNKDKHTDVGSSKGVVCFMTLVFKD